MHLEKKAQIRALIFDKASTEVSIEYINYRNIFTVKNTVELLKNSKIIDHTIKVKKISRHSLDPFIAKV